RVYNVTNLDMASGEGQLHYGLGIIQPGKVGHEYFMTRGHLHAWRPAAEVYICLQGQGMVILEHETEAIANVVSFSANSVVYVPGYTAHRTVNIGDQPLVYWGVYSSEAGHDYETIQERNFNQVVIELDGKPCAMSRKDYMHMLLEGSG
ncbi:MAG TPA: glucose-6-phosphate isomerase family protein, partial [Anaerolineales bacterium]|nr:glucose-6-phosphate isomerase family protein [Anaerolineales bacterium]